MFGIYRGRRLALYIVAAIVIATLIGYSTYSFVKLFSWCRHLFTRHNINLITTIKLFAFRILFTGEGHYFIKKAQAGW